MLDQEPDRELFDLSERNPTVFIDWRSCQQDADAFKIGGIYGDCIGTQVGFLGQLFRIKGTASNDAEADHCQDGEGNPDTLSEESCQKALWSVPMCFRIM